MSRHPRAETERVMLPSSGQLLLAHDADVG
jgi:hypothetical protein